MSTKSATKRSFEAWGRRIRVTVDRDRWPAVAALLPPGCRRASSARPDREYLIRGRARVEVWCDGAAIVRVRSLRQALAVFAQDVEQYVATTAVGRLFVHAGVVGWRGGALLIPGPSSSGKTTLVAALVRRGAAYYSDEFAVLDRRGRVHPYPRPLGIRGRGGRSRPVSPKALGGVVGGPPLPVRAVILTCYGKGARWRPRPVSPAHGVLEMLGHSVAARLRPGEALAVLQAALRRAAIVKGPRGEADHLAATLLAPASFRSSRATIDTPRRRALVSAPR